MMKQPLARSFLCFSLGLLLLMFTLLVTSHVPDDQQAKNCVVNVKLPGPIKISLDCDSPEFMRLALKPSGLLEPLNTRQARPGLIMAAAPLAWILSPLSGLAERLDIHGLRTDIDPQRISNALAKDLPAYLAYILLNVSIVLTTYFFFLRICHRWFDGGVAATVILTAIGFLLVTNDVVKFYIWSPHNQMFNILVPVFALYASMQSNTGALLRRRFAIGIGLATGIGCTAYPFFVIVLPCVAICATVFAYQASERDIRRTSIVNFIILSTLAFVPEIAWIAFVRLKTGGFYQYDIEHARQVLWMLDAWNQGQGVLVAMWLTKLGLLLWLAAMQIFPLAAIAAAAAGLRFVHAQDTDTMRPSLRGLAATAILVSTITVIFYASVGLVAGRAAYAILPPLIVVVAAAALSVTRPESNARQLLACICVVVATGAAIHTAVHNGARIAFIGGVDDYQAPPAMRMNLSQKSGSAESSRTLKLH